MIPPTMNLTPGNSKAIEVNETGYAANNQSLVNYARYQMLQSRQKYFIIHEMYRRDTWIRATIDYIVRRVTRDDNLLVDANDPLNPEIAELASWMEDCFPDGDFQDIYAAVTQDLLEYAQSYLYVERNLNGDPVHLYPMDSRIVFPVTDFAGTILFHAQVYAGQAQFFSLNDVLYFPMRNNGANPKGIPSMETLYESVAMEIRANEFNTALFQNNLNIGAVFSLPNSTDEQVDETRRYLIDEYSGPQNAYTPLLLSGDAKMLRDGSMAVKDINFELLIRVRRHRVSAVFGIPESVLGIPDNTNRSTSKTHERNSYASTIRPLVKRINRRFTHGFIRNMWGSQTISLIEPLTSTLPTEEELEAVDKIAAGGILFNDLLEMTGRARVPNGDYWLMKTPNGYERMDLTVTPGIGDKDFDFEAYKNQHDALAIKAAASGLPVSDDYVTPRQQDLVQTEPIGARIIDLSRSMEQGRPLEIVLTRRNPMNPGSRGRATLYQTKTGNNRYGTPPKSAPASPSSDGANTLTNPKDTVIPPTLPVDTRLAVAAMRASVDNLYREAQTKGWSNDDFFAAVERAGWSAAVGTAPTFVDASTARNEARRLAETNPSTVFTLLGADGHYLIMQKEIDNNPQPNLQPKAGVASDKTDTGNLPKLPGGKTDTGNLSKDSKSKQDIGNVGKRGPQDSGAGKL